MKILKFLFLFLIINIHSQNLNITGKVTDFSNKPIENATVYLIKKKDSAIISFVGTNNRGSFSIKIPKQKEPLILNINADQFFQFSKKYETIEKNIDLGFIKLEKDLVKNIDEIKLTASPIKIKKDTVEYNASYLKVKPDDKIEELLKQIPGVETDDNGNITVNGKPINKILINGKPVFNKDGKIVMQTFNADIIKKIQITTSKTKEEAFTGRTPITDSLTVNFNIDERNNKGDIRNLNFGYGTEKRYDAKVLLAKFKQQRNFALIAGANNINISDFSVDRFFESNNRNNSSNGRTINNGILETTIIGANFSDEIGEIFDVEKFSIEYKRGNLDTYNKTNRTTFLPNYKLNNSSVRNGNNDRKSSKINTDANLQLNKLTNIILSFDFNNSISDNISETNNTTSRDDILLNTNAGNFKSKTNVEVFKPKVTLVKNFKKPNRSFSASIDNTFSQNKNDAYNFQETIFIQSPENNENRNQRSLQKKSSNLFGANIKYSEPISDSASVSLDVNYDLQKIRNNELVNDFNEITQEFTDYNPLLSNALNENKSVLNSEISYQLNKNKYTFVSGINLEYTKLKLNSVFNEQNYALERDFVFPEYNVTFNYRFSKTETLRISNSSNFTAPQSSVLNPYIDISNPLITIEGNPHLKSSWQNNTNLSYNNFNSAKGTNFYANLGLVYVNNDVVDYSFYDETGKQFRTFANISGNKRVNVSTSYSKNYKWNRNSFKITPSISANHSFRKGFIEQSLFTNSIYNISPRLSFSLGLKDILNLKTSYGFSYYISNYTNYRVDKNVTSRHFLTLNLVNYFLEKSLFFNNYFSYSRNNNIASDFGRDSYFWNSSVTYQFYKKQMMLKLSAFDLLNQRQSATRIIADNYIEDNEQLVLKRYFMLSLAWNFSKTGASK